jgi:hypothetical protein
MVVCFGLAEKALPVRFLGTILEVKARLTQAKGSATNKVYFGGRKLRRLLSKDGFNDLLNCGGVSLPEKLGLGHPCQERLFLAALDVGAEGDIVPHCRFNNLVDQEVNFARHGPSPLCWFISSILLCFADFFK